MCRVDDLGGGFVEILAELAPEAVEHEFGSGLASGVLDNEVGIEVDTFFQFVLLDIASFVSRRGGSGRVAGRFLLDFEPSVHVLCKESILALFGWEMVNLVDLDESVPQLDGFLDLGGTPFSSERALLGGVATNIGLLQQGFGHFLFHTGLTEREREFTLVSVRQDGVI